MCDVCVHSSGCTLCDRTHYSQYCEECTCCSNCNRCDDCNKCECIHHTKGKNMSGDEDEQNND